jgi:hypothetical protein
MASSKLAKLELQIMTLSECMVRRRIASEICDGNLVCANVFGLLSGIKRLLAMMDSARSLPYKLNGLDGPLPTLGLESAGSTVVPSQ